MITLIRIELFKIFSRKRSYIAFIAILIIVMLTHGAVLWEGKTMLDFIFQGLADSFYLQGNLLNAYLVSYLILNFLWVHVPLLVVLVTGDLLSGEAHGGTFRLLLSRPVSRTSLVTVKYLAAFVYTLLLMVFFALLSLGLGVIFFGKGDLIVVMGAVNIIPSADVTWRFLGAFTYGLLAMTTVASLSLLISAMANNSLGPILTTMAIIMIFTLVSTLNLSAFRVVEPYFFTSYLLGWQDFFFFEVGQKAILFKALVLAGHIALFYIITVLYFRRKDILT